MSYCRRHRKIAIALIREERMLILVVEKQHKGGKTGALSYFREGDIPLRGEGRGLGLYNVHTILEKYPKSLISTRSANHLFSQTIQFCK